MGRDVAEEAQDVALHPSFPPLPSRREPVLGDPGCPCRSYPTIEPAALLFSCYSVAVQTPRDRPVGHSVTGRSHSHSALVRRVE